MTVVTSSRTFYNGFQPAFVLFGEHTPLVFNHLVDIGLQVRTSQTSFGLAIKLWVTNLQRTENQKVLTNVVLCDNASCLLSSLLNRSNSDVAKAVHKLSVADTAIEEDYGVHPREHLFIESYMFVEDDEELNAIIVCKLVVAIGHLFDEVFKAFGVLELLRLVCVGVGVLNSHTSVVERNFVGDVDHQLFGDDSRFVNGWIENERDRRTSLSGRGLRDLRIAT
ncbi:hypothetical protein D3C75_823410 [compost metagenome]